MRIIILAIAIVAPIIGFSSAVLMTGFAQDNRQSQWCLAHSMRAKAIAGRVLCIDADRRLVVPE